MDNTLYTHTLTDGQAVGRDSCGVRGYCNSVETSSLILKLSEQPQWPLEKAGEKTGPIKLKRAKKKQKGKLRRANVAA